MIIIVVFAAVMSVVVAALGAILWLLMAVPDIISVSIAGFGFLAFMYCMAFIEELNLKRKAAKEKSIRYHKRRIQIRRLLSAAHAHFF